MYPTIYSYSLIVLNNFMAIKFREKCHDSRNARIPTGVQRTNEGNLNMWQGLYRRIHIFRLHGRHDSVFEVSLEGQKGQFKINEFLNIKRILVAHFCRAQLQPGNNRLLPNTLTITTPTDIKVYHCCRKWSFYNIFEANFLSVLN